jgi:predicted membrane GTPase involved in stress response
MTALPTVELDPPTISMTFGVNDSPLAGRDGTHVSVSLFFSVIMCNVCKSIYIYIYISRIRWRITLENDFYIDFN